MAPLAAGTRQRLGLLPAMQNFQSPKKSPNDMGIQAARQAMLKGTPYGVQIQVLGRTETQSPQRSHAGDAMHAQTTHIMQLSRGNPHVSACMAGRILKVHAE